MREYLKHHFRVIMRTFNTLSRQHWGLIGKIGVNAKLLQKHEKTLFSFILYFFFVFSLFGKLALKKLSFYLFSTKLPTNFYQAFLKNIENTQ